MMKIKMIGSLSPILYFILPQKQERKEMRKVYKSERKNSLKNFLTADRYNPFFLRFCR